MCNTHSERAGTYPVDFGTTTPIFSSGGNFRRYRAEKPNGVIDLDYQRGYRPNTYTKHAGPSMGLVVLVPLVGGPYVTL